MTTLRTTVYLSLVMLFGGAAAAEEKEQQVIILGTDAGTFTYTGTTDPNVIQTSDTGTGFAVLLGKYQLTASEHINTVTLQVSNASFTIEASNGDKLFGTYSGGAQPGSAAGTVVYQVSGPITGGTGRFAGATGGIAFLGPADLNKGVFSDVVLIVINKER
jgi:hypothetical protein